MREAVRLRFGEGLYVGMCPTGMPTCKTCSRASKVHKPQKCSRQPDTRTTVSEASAASQVEMPCMIVGPLSVRPDLRGRSADRSPREPRVCGRPTFMVSGVQG